MMPPELHDVMRHACPVDSGTKCQRNAIRIAECKARTDGRTYLRTLQSRFIDPSPNASPAKEARCIHQSSNPESARVSLESASESGSAPPGFVAASGSQSASGSAAWFTAATGGRASTAGPRLTPETSTAAPASCTSTTLSRGLPAVPTEPTTSGRCAGNATWRAATSSATTRSHGCLSSGSAASASRTPTHRPALRRSTCTAPVTLTRVGRCRAGRFSSSAFGLEAAS